MTAKFAQLDALLSSAIRADEKLHARLEQLRNAPSPKETKQPATDIVILRDKYQAVSAYIQSLDKSTTWLKEQAELGVEIQLQPDAGAFIQHLKSAILKVMEPAASREPIATDLKEVILGLGLGLGDSYAEAEKVYGDLWTEAWECINTVLNKFDHDDLIHCTYASVAAVIGLLELRRVAAKELRRHLVCKIESATSSDDPSSYRPATQFLDLEFKTIKLIRTALKKHPWIRTHKPNPQRLVIHAGDWMKMKFEQDAQNFKNLEVSTATMTAVQRYIENVRAAQEAFEKKEEAERKPQGTRTPTIYKTSPY